MDGGLGEAGGVARRAVSASVTLWSADSALEITTRRRPVTEEAAEFTISRIRITEQSARSVEVRGWGRGGGGAFAGSCRLWGVGEEWESGRRVRGQLPAHLGA